MAKVIFGNHSSVIVPRKDRDNIRKFYCEDPGGNAGGWSGSTKTSPFMKEPEQARMWQR
jgi:hypothetical protein